MGRIAPDSRGLYLEIAPRGTKAWRFKYRFADKEKRISMGIYPEVSLKLARERRDDSRKLLARDIDPSAYRKAQKQSKRQWARNSFEAVAAEWLAKHSPNWCASYARRLEHDLGRDIFPRIGEKPVAELTAPELLAALRRIEARGTLDTAHRTLQVCGRVLRYAVATGRAERDVSGDLRGAFPPVKRKHFPAITDPKEVGPLLRLLDGYPGTLPVRCALRLVPLLFVRPGELRKAEWADIDLDGAEWRYTATKTDTPHVVPLARQAVEILRELHPVTGHHRYVFPNARYRQRDRTMSNTTFWGAFRALDIPRDRMTPHGFRAMARTILDEVLGFRPDFIEHQLAHRVRDPNGRALQPDGVPARAPRDDAGLGRLSGPAQGRGRDRGDSRNRGFPKYQRRRGSRNTNSRPAVPGSWSRASHGRPCPQLPARVLRGSADTPAGRSANWVIRRLAAALKTLPGGISGRERPRRGGWQVRAHVNPTRCRTRHPEGGVAPLHVGAAQCGTGGRVAATARDSRIRRLRIFTGAMRASTPKVSCTLQYGTRRGLFIGSVPPRAEPSARCRCVASAPALPACAPASSARRCASSRPASLRTP